MSETEWRWVVISAEVRSRDPMRSLALGASFVLQVFGGAAEQGVGALCDSQARAAHLVVQAAQGVWAACRGGSHAGVGR